MRTWLERRLGKWRRSVEFVGAVPPSRIADELSACDAVVLPSRWENFPFACIEAMSSGRPVIGSVAGGMSEMISHGCSGLLVDPRNVPGIADAILTLIDRPELASMLAHNGRKSILERLSPDRVFPLQMASYQRAVTLPDRRLRDNLEATAITPLPSSILAGAVATSTRLT